MKREERENNLKEKRPYTILPITVWLGLFLVIPAIFVLVLSFFTVNDKGVYQIAFTLKNYEEIFNPLVLVILARSIFIASFTTLFCLIFGYPFAYFIARSKKRTQAVLLLLVMLPFWTNSLVRTYTWIVLLGENGLINRMLMYINIIDKPLELLYTSGAVFVGMAYIMFPFMVLPLYSSIEKLDYRILEAAQDLGANNFQRFLKVTVPLTKGGIMSGVILVFVPTLGLFFIPDLLGGSKFMLVSSLIQNQFGQASNWPLGAAISVVLILFMLLILSIYKKMGGKAENMEVF